MKRCQPKLLVKGNRYNISLCKCCKNIGLYYDNILVNFRHNDFMAFASSVGKLNFDDNAVQFPDGNTILIMNTCHKDIQFTFTKPEFETLKEILQQAKIILEANYILSV